MERFSWKQSSTALYYRGVLTYRRTEMAELTTKQRKKMPASVFKGPNRSYPIPAGDRAHAANAKARATQQMKAGNLTPAQNAKIQAAANKVLKATAPKKKSK
jgi:hypothetical protein